MFLLILKEDRKHNPDLNHVSSSTWCHAGNKLEAFTSEVNRVTEKTSAWTNISRQQSGG